jgi:ubiquitin
MIFQVNDTRLEEKQQENSLRLKEEARNK